MNLPWMAHRTFQNKKADPAFFILTRKTIDHLKKLVSPIKRALFCQKEVQKSVYTIMNDPIVSGSVSCKEGCSHCCHTQVSITSDEAHLLLEKGIDTLSKKNSLNLLKIQKEAANSSEKWKKIPYSLRRCIFLDDNNSCTVYQYRPLVCRTNFVLGDPHQCSTIDGVEKPLRSLNTYKADMITMGAFIYSNKNGTLPYMIYQLLNNDGKIVKGPPHLNLDTP